MAEDFTQVKKQMFEDGKDYFKRHINFDEFNERSFIDI